MKLMVKDLLTDDKFLALSPAQKSFYVVLICHQWLAKGKGLTDDSTLLYLNSMAAGWEDEQGPEWQGFMSRLDQLFPKDKRGQRHNPKTAKMLEKEMTAQKGRSLGGKHTAQRRKE